MERMPKIDRIKNQSKLMAFLGGIASLGEGFASIGEGMADMFGGRGTTETGFRAARNQARNYYSVEEDPSGLKEDAANLRNDREKVLRRRRSSQWQR